MRHFALTLLCLSASLLAGCEMLDPNSRLNVNRGEYHDEFENVGKEARGNTAREPEVDAAGKWWYSPEAKSINRNLGVAD